MTLDETRDALYSIDNVVQKIQITMDISEPIALLNALIVELKTKVTELEVVE